MPSTYQDSKPKPNLTEALENIYNTLMHGDISCINADTRNLINKITMGLLQNKSWSNIDLYNAEIIIKISNIIYNNASDTYCPLEDGVYDLLIVQYAHEQGQYPVGAPPVTFGASDKTEAPTELKQLYHKIKYTEDSLFLDDIRGIYPDIEKNRDPYSYCHSLYIKMGNNVSKRSRNTAHEYPELVGTLDKCKFVLCKQARDRGVYDDPSVSIFERDFFQKHISMGLIKPDDRFSMVAELKYDGISIEAEVTDRVVSARTRGDTANDLAADLTPILEGYRFKQINGWGNEKPLGMKFEAIITYENLKKLSILKGKEYANCRNALTAIIGSIDGRRYRDLITLVPLAVAPNRFKTRIDEIEFLNRYYANDIYLCRSYFHGNYIELLFQIKKFVDEAEYLRDKMQFMYDGVVVSYDDHNLWNILGRENSVNKWSIAIKFNPMKKNTIFTGYTYTIGQNGVITPMIHYLPVEFYGTIHTKSSGHSLKRFNELNLAVGDVITVEYRNDVMPYVSKPNIEENDSNRIPEKIITHCPYCGTRLEFSDSGKTLYCPNINCSERNIMRMTNFLAKLGFKDFSEATVRTLGITKVSDLLFNEDDYPRLASLIGELTAKKLIKQIFELINTPIWDYTIVGAIGFTSLAIAKWRLIFQHITLQDLINLDANSLVDKLSEIKGIGDKAINVIIVERDLLKQDLLAIATTFNIKDSCNSDKKCKIRFTGFRDENLVSDILGAFPYVDIGEGSVTKDTDILLVPMEGFSSTKTKKAEQYGIRIIPIGTFYPKMAEYIELATHKK